MWAAMRSHKRLKSSIEPAALPLTVFMGWGGSGKSRKGFQVAAQYKGVAFLSLTAALLSSVPDNIRVLFKLTIAAFVARPGLILPRGSCLYIDEISMVPPELMNAVLARAKSCAVVCTGDVFQIQPIGEGVSRWFFDSEEYKQRNPMVTTIYEQHRLTGPDCEEVRTLLRAVAAQASTDWRTILADFISKRRTSVVQKDAVIIVFANSQITAITQQWAKKTENTLDRHGLCPNLPATITANKIESSGPTHVTYAHRNGQTGTIVKIGPNSTTINIDGTPIVVAHKGTGAEIPQIKSAVAQTADAAQGKTIDCHVHVIFPEHFFPHPAKIIVAASRSKSVSFHIPNERVFAEGIATATFDPRAVEYAARHGTI